MCCGHVFNEKRNTTPNTRTTSGYFGNAAKNKATQVKSLLQHVLRFLTALFFFIDYFLQQQMQDKICSRISVTIEV